MKVSILSRWVAERMSPLSVPHLIVSINCPDEGPARIASNDLTLGRVNLFFWDLDHRPVGPVTDPTGRLQVTDGSQIPEEHLFQPEHARQIVGLLDAHPSAEHLVVHCTAGISRSSGVGAAVHRIANGDDAVVFNDRRFRPNMRVYRAVLQAWHEAHPTDQE